MRINNSIIQVPSKILHRHHIFTLVANGYFNIPKAAKELKLSIRHTKRLWKAYRESKGSLESLNFKERTRKDIALKSKAKKTITEICQKHPDYSYYHLTDKLNGQGIKVSRETVRRIAKSVNGNSNSKSSKHKPSTRFEAETFGQIIQMDTCQGAWLKGDGYQYLIVCLDDHSRFVVFAGIFKADSTWTNMCAIRKMIETWGLPHILYTDNASHFKIIRHKKLQPYQNPEQYQTKIQEILAKLGVAHVTHHPFNPRAKGKIERFNRFIQDRFLRHNTARNLIELNYELYNWIKWYNYEHTNWTTKQKPCDRLSLSIFKPLPSGVNLDELFTIKETRKVRKDNSISFRSKNYFIPDRHHLAGLTVDISMTDSDFSVYSKGKFVIKFAIN